MWGAPYNQQQPPPGGPPVQPGMPPPQGGSWDNSQSGYPYGNNDDDQDPHQQGSALNSAVDLVTSAASNIFAYGNRQQQQQQQQPAPPLANNDLYRSPHGSAQPSPQQPPRPIQPTSSLLSTSPRTPIQQPAPIQVDSSLLSTSIRRTPAAPPMGMPNPATSAQNAAFGGPPPLQVPPSAGPPPIPGFGPQSMTAAPGNPFTASASTKNKAAAIPMTSSLLSSSKPPTAPSPAAAAATAPTKATIASQSTAPSSTTAPPVAAPSPVAPAPAPAPVTPQAAKKPVASLSPRATSTAKKLPLPPPSATLERRKRAPARKFKLPPTFKSTTPTSTPTSTKEKVSVTAASKSSTPTTPRTTAADVSSGPPMPSTPPFKPSISDTTPKVSNAAEASPKVTSQQQPPPSAVPGSAASAQLQNAPPPVTAEETQQLTTPAATQQPAPAPVPAPPLSNPPVQSEQEQAAANSTGGEALPPGWVELVHEASGQKYYWNEMDNITTWERPVTVTEEDAKKDISEHAANDNDDDNTIPSVAGEDSHPPTTTPKAEQPESTTEAADADQQLPEGWMEVVDETSGSTYYVNSVDNTTSWSRPSMSELFMDTPMKKPTQPEQAPEEKNEVAPEQQQQQQQQEEEEHDEANNDAPLPPGWIELKDEASGRSYYVHEGDDITTWDRPAPPPVSATTEEKPEAAGNEREEGPLIRAKEHTVPEVTHESSTGDMGYDVPTSPAAADTTMAILGDLQETEEEPLAPGWTEAYDPNSGRKYYVNEADNSRTWERPVAAMEDRPIMGAVAEQEQAEKRSEIPQSAPEVAGEREEGAPAPESTASATGETEDATAEGNMVESPSGTLLPPGWIEAFDPSSGAPYYFNAETNETRWEAPASVPQAVTQHSPQIENEDDTEDYVMVDRQEGQDSSAPENTYESSQESAPSSEVNFQGSSGSQGESDESSTLAPGWHEMKDPTTGKLCYVNEAQNRTVWDKPLLETASVLSSAPDVPVDGADTDMGLAREVIEEETMGDQGHEPGPTIDNSTGALPPGWQELVDPNTKVTFYYNDATGKSSWERPAALDESIPEQKPPSRLTTMDELNADVKDVKGPDSEQEPSPEQVSGVSHETRTDESAESGASSHLPPGWVEATDPLSGRVYYVNEVAGTSSWELPVAKPESSAVKNNSESMGEEDVDTPELTAAIGGQAETPTEISDNTEVNRPEEDLPPGWVAVDDPSTGSVFYFNEAEQRTSWEKPPHPEPRSPTGDVPTYPIESTESTRKDRELLPGWEESVDPTTGSVFYFNEAEGLSSWERPVVAPVKEGTADDTENETLREETNESGPTTISESDIPVTLPEEPEETPQEVDKSTAPSAESMLPPGWVESVDPVSGDVFYFNEADGRTSWERPMVQTEEDMAVGTGEKVVADTDTKDDPAIAQEQSSPEPPQGQPEETHSKGEADDAEWELAPGWVESVDPASGNTFYFNEADGRTQWERPTSPIGGDAVEGIGEEPVAEFIAEDEPTVPQDQTLLETPLDSTEETQLSDATRADSELPPGWVESVDPGTGRTFYFNEAEGRTQWERPTVTAGGDATGGTGEEPVVETVVEDESAVPQDQTLLETPLDSTEEMQLSDATRADSELPPGWVESVDPGTGRTFYFNEAEGRTQWERPTVKAGGDATGGTGEEPVVETVVDDESAVPQDQTLLETPLDSTEETQLSNATPADSELPPGWVESVDPGTGRTFYFNEAEGRTQWERPTAQVGGDATGGTGEEPVVETVVDDESAVPQDQTLLETPLDSTEETQVTDVSVVTPPADSELLPGWVESADPGTGKIFYFNEAEGRTQWERPTIPVGKDVADDTADEPVVEDVGVGHEHASQVPLGDPPEQQQQNETVSELPPGWIEAVDPATGSIYFFNEIDNVSSWERPASITDEPETLRGDDDGAPVDPVIPADAEPSVEIEEPLEAPSHDVVTGEPIVTEEVDQALAKGDGVLQLAPGWVEVVDPRTGDVYYFNEADNATSWDPPTVKAAENGPVEDAVKSAGSIPAETTEPEIVTDAGALPPGWVEVVDPSSGENYFFNQTTNETSWERPLSTPAKAEISGDKADAPSNDGVLPQGWEELLDPNGDVYYYNEALDMTQWERPGISAQASESAADKAVNSGKEKSQSNMHRMRPGHGFATFGFGGKLCVWRFGQNTKRQPVEIHRVSDVIPTHHLVQAEATKQQSGILGPLDGADSQTVKSYVKHQTEKKPKDLLWQLLRIASAFKGKLRSDAGASDPRSPESAILDLLLKEGVNVSADPQNGINGIPGPVQSIEEERNGNGVLSDKSKIETIQNLILRGKREAAVELAMETHNYALALLVGSYCDPETFHRVSKQFAEKILRSGTPLYTITMLFTGQILDSSIWSDSSSELLDSWTYHLAAIISNRTGGWDRVVFTLGTKLKQLGDMNSAHFCYMVCGLQLSSPTLPHTNVSLLGCDHLIPECMSLMTAEGIEAFGRTEAYEWAKRRGNRSAVLKTLQPFKLYYAMLLADIGYIDLAKMYLESILRMCELEGHLDRFDSTMPAKRTLPEMCESSEAFKTAVADFEQRLFRSVRVLTPVETKEPALPTVEEASQDNTPAHPVDTFNDFTSPAKSSESDMTFMTAATHLQDTTMADGASKLKKKDTGQKLARVKRTKPKSEMQGSGETPEREQPPGGPPPSTHVASAPPSQQLQTPTAEKPSSTAAPRTEKKPPESSTERKKPEPSPKSAPAVMSQSNKAGWLAGIRDTITKKLNPDATTADIGESMQAYYDEDKKVWVFPGEDPAEVAKPLPPPPTPMMDMTQKQEEKPKPDMAKDPLAAMMAPPQRTPATLARSRAAAGGGGGVPSTPRSLYSGMPGMPSSATPGSAGGTPQFMVFQPKPEQTNAVAEEKTEPPSEE